MKYAPVLIPTLCRYEHFRRCIESLSECTGAENTEVYIALDYPAKEVHEEGYRLISSYLDNSGIGLKFKDFHIIKRERNYGIGIGGNFYQARMDLFDHYDRLIFSEDDNVFSPNFLMYINKGLDLFENDMSVLAINGYCHPYHFKFADNNHFRHNVDFSAWGYGIWKNRIYDCEKEINNGLFRSSLSLRNLWNLKCAGWNRLLEYLSYIKNNYRGERIQIIDNVLSVYMRVKGMTVIMPRVSKVRNIGWDTSGCSFPNCMSKIYSEVAAQHNRQLIDMMPDFEYEGDPFACFTENNQVAVQESDGRISFGRFVLLLLASGIRLLRGIKNTYLYIPLLCFW